MKKIRIALVPMLLVIGACAPHVSGFGIGPGELMAKRPCEDAPVPPMCSEGDFEDVASLRITLNPAKVVIHPETICVYSPGKITVNIKSAGKPGRNSVRMVPEDIADLWLFGDNRKNQYEFTLIVDEAVAAGNYDYGVTTRKSGCIDPRITVGKR